MNIASGRQDSRQLVVEGEVTTYQPLPHDKDLYEQARSQWRDAEWESLIRVDIKKIETHPEKAKLALIVASAWLQQGDNEAARSYLHRALEWGCSKKLATQILAAGVHNTLGRAAAIVGDHDRMEQHFRRAVTGGGSPIQRASLDRQHVELKRLGLLSPSASAAGMVADKDANFYRAFEDRFRGSRELIKSRLSVYLPFVQPVAARHPDLKAIDLGCGRGEWLELLSEAGITAYGVDIDLGMLRDSAALGLSVQQGDALVTLRQQPSRSSICISLIHVVEHLPFDVVKQLVKEAKRVLVEDGILIMETPNPENYTVGACNFYMDPTHRNPLPPPLLAFVPEYYGFERVKIIRLQEQPVLAAKPVFDASDYLTGVSPDYAVLAQARQPECEVGEVWVKEYGINIDLMQARNAAAKVVNQ